jgi:hypothetical protein
MEVFHSTISLVSGIGRREMEIVSVSFPLVRLWSFYIGQARAGPRLGLRESHMRGSVEVKMYCRELTGGASQEKLNLCHRPCFRICP